MLEIDWMYILDLSAFLLLCRMGIIVAAIMALGAVGGAHSMWLSSSDRNPYRRKCRKCGQQQEAYGRTYNKSQWWEDTLPVPDEECICHSYSTYHP